MAEFDWKTSRDPEAMIDFLQTAKARHAVTARKVACFGLACADERKDRPDHYLIPLARQAVDKGARLRTRWVDACYAYGKKVKSPRGLRSSVSGLISHSVQIANSRNPSAEQTIALLRNFNNRASGCGTDESLPPVLASWRADLLRDIFGPDPSKSLPEIDPEWRTEAVVGLARGIYEDNAFDRLPVLADALDDAGCDNPDILENCRSPGPHMRGNWVVDGILDKDRALGPHTAREQTNTRTGITRAH